MVERRMLSNVALPFSVLIIAVLIVTGGMFLLDQLPNTSSIQQTQEDTLSLSALNNLEYYHLYCKVPMKLTDSVFRWTDDYPCKQEKPFGFLFQIYNEKIAIGDLDSDGKNDAAVVLTTNYGGSGNFRELAVVINQNSEPKHVTSTDLGDRVIVNDIFIQENRILLDMIVHGPGEGYCCPTQPAQKTFRFDAETQEIIEL